MLTRLQHDDTCKTIYVYVCLQVSVTAEQNSRLLTWSSSGLRQYLTCDSHLLMVFDLIIGNDIASKLYSVRSRPRHTAVASFVSVPATRSLPLQLNVGDHHSVHTVRSRTGRPEQLPLKSRLPSFSGKVELFIIWGRKELICECDQKSAQLTFIYATADEADAYMFYTQSVRQSVLSQ